MKKVLLFFAVSLTGLTTTAQSSLTVTIDLTYFSQANHITNCIMELTSADTMYLHSGACAATSVTPADCDNPSFVWEHVVGNWGMGDGIGKMTQVGDSVWSIDLDLNSYYSNPNTISSGSTVMPGGSTVYTVGFVFRNQDGTIGGQTSGCDDFFIFNVDGGNTAVDEGGPGNPVDMNAFSNPTGLPEFITVEANNVYPNPFTDQTRITYNLNNYSSELTVRVYNLMGQEVATLYDGPQTAGSHSLTWNGTDNNGKLLDGGAYIYHIMSEGNGYAERLVVVR